VSRRSLPNFFIIGAAKSGTTAFAEWLRAHPEIYIPPEKELHYFDWQYNRNGWDLARYESRFAKAGDAPLRGEGSPYMGEAEAVERIADVLPTAKHIAILRDPVDRAYSHYWYRIGFSREDRTFREAIDQERAGTSRGWPYLRDGIYVDQLERLERLFSRERLLVLLFDDLKVDAVGQYKAACEFLGADPTFVPANIDRTYNSTFRWRSLRLQLLQQTYQRRLHVPWPVRRAITRLNQAPLRYPPLDDETRTELAAYFAPHNARLASFLGRDLSGWSR
jgi:hypothetical protein